MRLKRAGWGGGIGRWWERLRPIWPRSRIPSRASGGGAFSLALPLDAPTFRELPPRLPDGQSP